MTIFKSRFSTTVSSRKYPTIPFPTLPLELREYIYSLAILPSPPHPQQITISAADSLSTSFRSSHPYFLPPLCHLNSPTCTEVSLWFIRNTFFNILYPQHLDVFGNWLDTLPDTQGWETVRRVDMQLFGRHVARPIGNEYLIWLRRCTGLTEIRIKFEVWYVLKHIKQLHGRENLTLEDFIGVYALHGLFELRSLTELRIEVWPKILTLTKWGLRDVDQGWWPVMLDLREWVVRGYEEREQKVMVELVESENSGLRWAGGRGLR